VPAPSGVAFSVDAKRIYIASSEAHSVTAFDVQAGTRTTASCDCAPTGLVPMGNVFRLNEFSSEPLWLFDTDAAEPRIVFVPAVTPAN
jgi:hypothetical protein